MNEGFPEDPGPREPGLDPLIELLTSAGTPGGLAGEAEALAMFRATSAAAGHAAANAVTAAVPPPGAAAVPPPGVTVPPSPTAPTAPGARPPATVRTLPTWRRRGRLISVTAVAAAAAVLAAAYTATLPAPVQHVAYQALHFAGVPDAPSPSNQPSGAGAAPPDGQGTTNRPGGAGSAGPGAGSSSAPAPSPGQSVSPTPTAPSPGSSHSPSPGRSHSPGPGGGSPNPSPTPTPTPTTPPPVPSILTIAASASQIIAGSSVSLTGMLTDDGGTPVPDQTVTLLEHAAGVPGWQPAGQGTTDSAGAVTITVPVVASDAGFRLKGPEGTHSGHVRVVVVPAVSLTVGPGPRPQTDHLVASAPYATGDTAILQVRSGGGWKTLRSHVVDPSGQVVFGVHIGHATRVYRVVVPHTTEHAKGVSNPAVVPGAS